MFDQSRLGGWADLPFFTDALPEIEAALRGQDILPPSHKTFAALEMCQPKQTKVIIIGQDPYHTPGKADGLAFSIPQGFGGRLDSLGNIFKELQSDLNVERTRSDLSDWANQGVLLINIALTVPPGKPKAHAKLGWSKLIPQIIEKLADRPRVGVFWGGPAQKFAPLLGECNLILTSAHPSPLSVYRGFFGSRPFSRTNQWLRDQGQTPINWADP
jgi:uracil-DNA glycosylase